MNADKRLWRTDNENELVLDGDPKARVLAYGEDDEIDKDDEAAAKKVLGSKSKADESSEDKQAAPAANKKQAAPANKSK